MGNNNHRATSKMLYRYYIGSNNQTGELEARRAIKIVSQSFQGFTAYNAMGYWNGKSENSLILEIETTELEKLKAIAKQLCQELKQEAVGLAEVGKMDFISL